MENYVELSSGEILEYKNPIITCNEYSWVDANGQRWFTITTGESNITPLTGDPTEKEVEKKLEEVKREITKLYADYRPWYEYEDIQAFLVGRVALEVLEPLMEILDMDCPPDWPEDF